MIPRFHLFLTCAIIHGNVEKSHFLSAAIDICMLNIYPAKNSLLNFSLMNKFSYKLMNNLFSYELV